MIVDEPVRGRIPPPWFWALPGIDRIQALSDGRVARPPLFRLLSLKPGHVSPGSCAWTMPASEWLVVAAGVTDIYALAETALMSAAMTTLQPGLGAQAVTLSCNHLRPPRAQPGRYLARARVVSASRFYVFGSVEIEDPEGRRIMDANGHFAIEPVEPPPPAPPAMLMRIEEPTYDTPDPLLRPLVDSPRGDLSAQPYWRLLGASVELAGDGTLECALQTCEWHCRLRTTVPAALTASVVNGLASTFAQTMIGADETFAGLEQSIYFYRPLPADGRTFRVLMRPAIRARGFLGAEASVLDADGAIVASGRALGAVIPATQRRMPAGPPAKRILATLLFADIVGSTDHLARLGDAGWTALRDAHRVAARAKIAEYDGIEVDTAGDGFLARFESPARALDCARGIRDAVARLGVQLRIGVHTGECELRGREVTGMAVHVAARLEATAQPGEVVVSEMVRGLVMGSAHAFEDRGEHELKGVPGAWRLYALRCAS